MKDKIKISLNEFNNASLKSLAYLFFANKIITTFELEHNVNYTTKESNTITREILIKDVSSMIAKLSKGISLTEPDLDLLSIEIEHYLLHILFLLEK